MSTNRRLLHHGQRCSVYFLVTGTRCRAIEFLESLQPKDRSKANAALRYVADYGPPQNEQKYRHLQAPVPLWELKPTSQVRFIGFWDGPADFVITHGFFKRRSSDTHREIQTALRLRDEYYADRN